MFDSIRAALVEQSPSAGKPPVRVCPLRRLADECVAQPECAARCPDQLTSFDKACVGTSACLRADRLFTDQVSRSRETVEILGLENDLAAREREFTKRFGPRLTLTGRPAACHRLRPGHTMV
ncbi:MAG TPA: hypothetical protein VL220_15765 [Steroidobacteraceae bacterium]|nr:hypothetical protein [Steroidobacteraceae bacterium]